jgi:hypothetical protein
VGQVVEQLVEGFPEAVHALALEAEAGIPERDDRPDGHGGEYRVRFAGRRSVGSNDDRVNSRSDRLG